MIETRLLQYFLAVAEEQSITKAAEYLHISQPTLSKQMMDLEENLGTESTNTGVANNHKDAPKYIGLKINNKPTMG